jgi:hypothetical protein
MSTDFRRGVPVMALLAIALIAGGCGTSAKSPTGPTTTDLTQSEANDVAVQTTFALDQVGLDVEGAASGLLLAPGLRQGALPLRSARAATLGSDGLNAEFLRSFYDAEDNVLAEFGPTAVRMNWKSHIWGTVESLRDTATIQHHSDFDFTGIQLLDTALVINGACADTLLNTFRSLDSLVTRHGYWRSRLTAAGIAMRKYDGLPLSGTLTYVVRADVLRSSDQGDVEKHLSAIVVITFNGTLLPDVVINGVHHYKWDMQHGAMVAV